MSEHWQGCPYRSGGSCTCGVVGGVEFVWMSDVEERVTDWLWKPRIPRRNLTVVEGDPDLGKSTSVLDVVARETSGAPWPGEIEPHDPGVALVITAEDSLEETVKPRLRAGNADMTRVAAFTVKRDQKGRPIPLAVPDDLDKVEALLEKIGATLVVIDPITAYLSEDINPHVDGSVRRALLPLKEMAERTGVAVVLIRHLNKSGDAKALYRGGGSIAFTGAARVVLLASEHPRDPESRVLARVKGNLAKPFPAWTYRLEDAAGVPRVEWVREEQWSADELLRANDSRQSTPAQDEAEEWLVALLREREGIEVVKALKAAAKEVGLAWSTVDRVSGRMLRQRRLKKEKVYRPSGGIAAWAWVLVGDDRDEDDDRRWDALLRRSERWEGVVKSVGGRGEASS